MKLRICSESPATLQVIGHVHLPTMGQAGRRIWLKSSTLAVSPVVFLFGLWALLYGPYIAFGGFIRDDYGFLTQPRGVAVYMGWLDQPRGFGNYLDFQPFVSSFPTMTGRPVSAILHGLCYWFFRTTVWPYHLINLTLFLASVLLVYRAVEAITSRELALTTATFALICPTASGTVFSSIMMNSNLAAVFWAMALYLDAVRQEAERRWQGFAVVVLLLLSSLSYEAFIPLFVVNILMRAVKRNNFECDLRQSLIDCAPALTALMLFVGYREWAEKLIFASSISPINMPSYNVLVSRFAQALALGIRESSIQSIRISVNSLHNLNTVTMPHWLVIFASVIALSLSVYASIRSQHNVSRIFSDVSSGGDEPEPIAIRSTPWLYLVLIAIGVFVVSHLIFVFSIYVPNSSGFESRTQGAIRFAVGFLIASGIICSYRLCNQLLVKRVIVLGAISLAVLFMLSIVGQRQAWIAAAQYNNFLLYKMDTAIRRSKLNQLAAFTFVADLPEGYPQQVNAEPIFGEAWDMGPALSLLYPLSNIRANVYEPSGTIIQPDQAIFHGYWQARYPFYFYRFSDDNIYLIASAGDLRPLLADGGLR